MPIFVKAQSNLQNQRIPAMKKLLKLIAASVGAIMVLALTPVVAGAATSSVPNDTVRAVEQAVGPYTEEANPSVALPQRTGQPVRLSGTEAGANLTITPELNGTSLATRIGGTTVVSDDSNSVAIQPLTHGVRLMSVFSSKARNSTTYKVQLPSAETLQLDPLGGVLVIQNGKWVGRFNAPWALDAANRSLPTSYSITSNTITQTVDTTGAQFPVVADPHYTWGIITGTVYFNKSETAQAGASATFITAIAAFAPPPFNIILVVYAASISYTAQMAGIHNKCLAVNNLGFSSEYSGTQGDGYCR